MAKPKKVNVEKNIDLIDDKEQENVVPESNEEIIIVDENGKEYTEKELDEKEFIESIESEPDTEEPDESDETEEDESFEFEDEYQEEDKEEPVYSQPKPVKKIKTDDEYINKIVDDLSFEKVPKEIIELLEDDPVKGQIELNKYNQKALLKNISLIMSEQQEEEIKTNSIQVVEEEIMRKYPELKRLAEAGQRGINIKSAKKSLFATTVLDKLEQKMKRNQGTIEAEDWQEIIEFAELKHNVNVSNRQKVEEGRNIEQKRLKQVNASKIITSNKINSKPKAVNQIKLTKDEYEVCKMMGISPQDYIKGKKR